MNSHIDSAPAASWSGNSIAAGTPGTAGTVDSSVQPDPSQQTAIEDWESEGGSARSPPGTASADHQGAAEHRLDATARTEHLPPWLLSGALLAPSAMPVLGH